MKNHALSRPLRLFLILLLMAASVAAFWSGLYPLSLSGDLWTHTSYQESSQCMALMDEYANDLEELLRLKYQDEDTPLSYLQNKRLEALEARFQAENTNFRFQVHDEDRNLLLSNLDSMSGTDLASVVSTVYLSTGNLIPDETYTVAYDSTTPLSDDCEMLFVSTPEGMLSFTPGAMTAEDLGTAAQYGWTWVPVTEDPVTEEVTEASETDSATNSAPYETPVTLLPSGYWAYTGSTDLRAAQTLNFAIEYGLPAQFTVEDEFSADAETYDQIMNLSQAMFPVCLASLLLSAVLFFVLMRSAGWQKGAEAVTLRPWDRWGYEWYLLALCILFGLELDWGDSVFHAYNLFDLPADQIVLLAAFSLSSALLLYLTASTTAVRLKAHTFRNSFLTVRLCRWLWTWLRRGGEVLWRWLVCLPLYRRVVVLFVLYLAGGWLIRVLFRSLYAVPTLLYQGAALFLICQWVSQWRTIRAAAEQAADGQLDCQIDTTRMYPDLRDHADQLNRLSDGLNKAVNERMKSEHFKSELITNVSHDLKTPLTSIINYVDLLKKTDLQDPTALEYIEVLDRKSQRLKKLTEDLVEASKASTGTLTVNREKINMGQLVDQAVAEYADRLADCGLTPVRDLPDQEAYVSADGRHLWRVIDNLLSNCCKYALPGTRVYLDLSRWDGQVLLTVKNISRDPLNLPADALMERFVRGDAARTTEGSGLGLSIARSLTELQGGSFRLAVDGDLFKATLSFPEVREA